MEDSKIIALFFARSEQAISELSGKYGKLCFRIASNILGNEEDAEECVNDAYLGAWNTIPPQKPNPLQTYICKIVRNVATSKYHSNTALKRNSHYDLALEELEQCVAGSHDVEKEIEKKELVQAINRFLDTLPVPERRVFLARYWYMDSIQEIAAHFKFSQSKVMSMLFRTRNKLRRQLEKEGYL